MRSGLSLKNNYVTTSSSSQRVEARLESFDRFIFHDLSPMPSEAEIHRKTENVGVHGNDLEDSLLHDSPYFPMSSSASKSL